MEKCAVRVDATRLSMYFFFTHSPINLLFSFSKVAVYSNLTSLYVSLSCNQFFISVMHFSLSIITVLFSLSALTIIKLLLKMYLSFINIFKIKTYRPFPIRHVIFCLQRFGYCQVTKIVSYGFFDHHRCLFNGATNVYYWHCAFNRGYREPRS